MIIAIQPDDYTNPKKGKTDASSPRWAKYIEKQGHQVRWVDVQRPDILEQIQGCDGFMWRHGHWPDHRQIAKRLLPIIENELGLEVYPDYSTAWHFDDKIAQFYLFSAAGIPTPKTWVWFEYQQALEWASTAKYPLVIKLWSGASSENVRLVENAFQAKIWIEKLFKTGIGSMNEILPPVKSFHQRLRSGARILVKGVNVPRARELHKNYVYFQEYVPGNDFDIRIVVIGNRAFGKIRPNRPNDFRASGSGILDSNPDKIPTEALKLAFYVTGRLQTQSLALDFLRKGNEYLVSEISYTYPSYTHINCPGHWELKNSQLIWKPGRIWAEQAQVEDFLERLEKKEQKRSQLCV